MSAAGNISVAVTEGGGLYSWGHQNTHYPFKSEPVLFNNLRVVDAQCAATEEKNAFIVVKTDNGQLWALGQEKLQVRVWGGRDPLSVLLVLSFSCVVTTSLTIPSTHHTCHKLLSGC